MISFLALNLGISGSLSGLDSTQGIQTAYAAQFRLFAHDNVNSQIIEINPATGQATVVGSTTIGSGASALASSRINLNLVCGNFAKGTHFGIFATGGVDKVVTVDTSTGVAAPVSNNDVGLGGRGVGFDNAGTFYATDSSGNGQLYTVNICDASKTALPNQIGFPGVDNIQWDPVSLTFIGISGNTLVSINPATGAGTALPNALSQNINSCTIARDPGTGTWYSINTNNGDLVTIDLNSGMVNVVGNKNNAAISSSICGTAFEEVPSIVGGEIIPLNTTALLVAGVQSNTYYLIGILALAGIGITITAIRKKH